MVLVNSGFYVQGQFLQKSTAVWAHALRNIRQPCPMQQTFIEYWFEGACPGSLHALGQPSLQV